MSFSVPISKGCMLHLLSTSTLQLLPHLLVHYLVLFKVKVVASCHLLLNRSYTLSHYSTKSRSGMPRSTLSSLRDTKFIKTSKCVPGPTSKNSKDLKVWWIAMRFQLPWNIRRIRPVVVDEPLCIQQTVNNNPSHPRSCLQRPSLKARGPLGPQ